MQSELRHILEALESFVFSMCFQLENFILQKEPVILSYEPLISVFFYDLSQSILSKLNYFFFLWQKSSMCLYKFVHKLLMKYTLFYSFVIGSCLNKVKVSPHLLPSIIQQTK